MPTSAGLLLYRLRAGRTEVLLVHPGGPYWAARDAGAWSIPKGVISAGADGLREAQREFREETGQEPPAGPYHALGQVRQRGGKLVIAWAAAGDEVSVEALVSNTFRLEWPPRSGQWVDFPEVDRAGWFDWATANEKLLEAQRPFLERLRALLQMETDSG